MELAPFAATVSSIDAPVVKSCRTNPPVHGGQFGSPMGDARQQIRWLIGHPERMQCPTMNPIFSKPR